MVYTEHFGGLRTALRLILVVCFLSCFSNFVDSSPLNSKKVAEGIVSINFNLSSLVHYFVHLISNNIIFQCSSRSWLKIFTPLSRVYYLKILNQACFAFASFLNGNQAYMIQTNRKAICCKLADWKILNINIDKKKHVCKINNFRFVFFCCPDLLEVHLSISCYVMRAYIWGHFQTEIIMTFM